MSEQKPPARRLPLLPGLIPAVLGLPALIGSLFFRDIRLFLEAAGPWVLMGLGLACFLARSGQSPEA